MLEARDADLEHYTFCRLAGESNNMEGEEMLPVVRKDRQDVLAQTLSPVGLSLP